MSELILIADPDSVWAALIIELVKANQAAKAISRRGMVAMLRPEYASEHEHINELLTLLEAMS